MTMITPSYLGETIEYSSLHACRSTLEDPTFGLPQNTKFLGELCRELKRACGTGGAVSDDTIELQGDLRDRVREYLLKKKFAVKG